ncbi:MAG: PQQ-dependent sugar dehydrogenase, partial [Verrucomicrobia bacterium]|nr:PQQ-dependent sugar dehydrogenase [Verrucomicrobiota bacterium]
MVAAAVLGCQSILAEPRPSGPQVDGDFRKVILDSDREINGVLEDTLKDPMELAVAQDGRVFYIQRDGTIKLWKPATRTTVVIGQIPVFTGLEDGLLGLALDPHFLRNGWIYLYHSLPETTLDAHGKKAGQNVISRFTVAGDRLDPASEKVLLRVRTQREQCCHSGGALAFDAHGNLYSSAGDNTNPFASDGFAPLDERPGRSPWDSQKSASNPNDLRGKINRIHPEPDGSCTIPPGNLFPPGTPGTRPEIYIMGCRNPFRISLDPRNGYLYWGEVGPDAGGPNPERGPAGFDEINQARVAGNFGWPYFIADNRPYHHYDFATGKSGPAYDPAHPVNDSPNNTGAKLLPPAQPAFIYYTYGLSTRFPVVNGGGGRTAMAGPVYYFDSSLASPHKLPRRYDHTLFIYEWSRNWIVAVRLDAHDHIARRPNGALDMERFCPHMTFKRPIDLEMGPDGCLYVIEFGSAWGN